MWWCCFGLESGHSFPVNLDNVQWLYLSLSDAIHRVVRNTLTMGLIAERLKNSFGELKRIGVRSLVLRFPTLSNQLKIL